MSSPYNGIGPVDYNPPVISSSSSDGLSGLDIGLICGSIVLFFVICVILYGVYRVRKGKALRTRNDAQIEIADITEKSSPNSSPHSHRSRRMH